MSQFAFHISPDGENHPIELNKAAPSQADGGFFWFNLNPQDQTTEGLLFETLKIDPSLKDLLFNTVQRPRLEVFDDYLFISLRGVNFSEKSSPEDMVNLRILIYKNMFFTLHTRDMRSILAMKDSVEKHTRYASIAPFLTKLVGLLNARISEEVDDLNDKINTLEELSLMENIEKHQDQLSEARRSLFGFQKHLIPQANVLHTLWDVNAPWLKKRDQVHLKNQAEKLSTVVGELDQLRQRATVVQEEIKSSLSEHMGRSMYRLSIVATIMLPLGLFAGLMGANVGGMPYTNSPYGFLIICLMSLALGIGVFLVLKLLKWI